eukprot:1180927-Amphidinium_carterae.1
MQLQSLSHSVTLKSLETQSGITNASVTGKSWYISHGETESPSEFSDSNHTFAESAEVTAVAAVAAELSVLAFFAIDIVNSSSELRVT